MERDRPIERAAGFFESVVAQLHRSLCGQATTQGKQPQEPGQSELARSNEWLLSWVANEQGASFVPRPGASFSMEGTLLKAVSGYPSGDLPQCHPTDMSERDTWSANRRSGWRSVATLGCAGPRFVHGIYDPDG